jgi:hypothetical protein
MSRTNPANRAAQALPDSTPDAKGSRVFSTRPPQEKAEDFHGIVFGLGPLESLLESFSEGIEAAFERGLADAQKRDGAFPDHVRSIR